MDLSLGSESRTESQKIQLLKELDWLQGAGPRVQLSQRVWAFKMGWNIVWKILWYIFKRHHIVLGSTIYKKGILYDLKSAGLWNVMEFGLISVILI